MPCVNLIRVSRANATLMLGIYYLIIDNICGVLLIGKLSA
jgi:hypothetical protein